MKQLKTKLGKFTHLESKYEEIELMIAIGNEENDISMVDTVKEELEAYKQAFNMLRLETLFTGEYDANNAIVTIHPGAGGTESQDWAEMLYRMYLRWCEKKGYKIELLDIVVNSFSSVFSLYLYHL